MAQYDLLGGSGRFFVRFMTSSICGLSRRLAFQAIATCPLSPFPHLLVVRESGDIGHPESVINLSLPGCYTSIQ